MGLSCGCDFEDGPSILREKLVKARKQHKCCECGNTIEIGDEYEYVFGVWDGESSQFHTCEKCSDLRASLQAVGFCVPYQELLSCHRQYLNDDY